MATWAAQLLPSLSCCPDACLGGLVTADLEAGPHRFSCTSRPSNHWETWKSYSPLSMYFLLCKLGILEMFWRSVWLVNIKHPEQCLVDSHVSSEWSWERMEVLRTAEFPSHSCISVLTHFHTDVRNSPCILFHYHSTTNGTHLSLGQAIKYELNVFLSKEVTDRYAIFLKVTSLRDKNCRRP